MDEKQAHQEEETVGRTVTQAASGTNVVVRPPKSTETNIVM